MASPTPVFPEVGSTIVPPGRRRPSRSAASIIRSPIRSLTEPPGLSISSLPSRVHSTSGPILSSRNSGVRPTRSSSESAASISALRWRPVCESIAPGEVTFERLAADAWGDLRGDPSDFLDRGDAVPHLVQAVLSQGPHALLARRRGDLGLGRAGHRQFLDLVAHLHHREEADPAPVTRVAAAGTTDRLVGLEVGPPPEP